MIGLLWKDILYLKKIWKVFLFLNLCFVAFGCLSYLKNKNFLDMSYIILILGESFAVLAFEYDHNSKWKEYQYAFPVSKKTVVCSRYLFGFIIFGFYFFSSLVGILLSDVITRESIGQEWILTQIGIICFIPMMQAVAFPILYYFGSKKGILYSDTIFIVMMFYFGKNANMLDFHFTATKAVLLLLFYLCSLILSIKIEQRS